jgi:hypothetical protein
VVTPPDTRTPIDAIFAPLPPEPFTHTPVYGVSRTSVAMPSSPSAATIARSMVCTKSATRSTAMIG